MVMFGLILKKNYRINGRGLFINLSPNHEAYTPNSLYDYSDESEHPIPLESEHPILREKVKNFCV
jgi:hypothetical protein